MSDSAQTNSETKSAKEKKGVGITFRLVLTMLVIGLMPLVIFGSISMTQTSKQLHKDTEIQMQRTAMVLAGQVNQWIDKNILVLKTAAELSAIKSSNPELQTEVLQAIQNQYPWMYLVFTTDAVGNNIARNDGKALKDYRDRKYVKDILSGRNMSWQNLIGKTSKKPALILSVPYVDGNGDRCVLAAAMSIDEISKTVANLRIGNSGFAFLVDDHGKIVSHPDPSITKKQQDFSDHPLMGALYREKDVAAYFTSSSKEYMGVAVPAFKGWTLCLNQEKKEVFQGLSQLLMIASIIFVISALIVIVIAFVSAKSITRPILELTKAADEMSMGNMDVAIDISSKDEIGQLAQSIKRLQASLQLAMKRLKKKRQATQE